MSMRAMITAASGMGAQSVGLDVVANNLANLETTGFQGSRVAFENLVSGRLAAGAGTGTAVAAININPQSGTLAETGRSLDVAIDGPAYFAVKGAQGESLYTRAGNFTLDGEGRLVVPGTGEAYPLEPEVRVPAGADGLAIAPDGMVTALVGGQLQTIGQIRAVRFLNPEGLAALGGNLLAETGASGSPMPVDWGSDGVALRQGYLESSNVDPTSEIVALISTQRAFSLSAEVFRAADERLRLLTALTASS